MTAGEASMTGITPVAAPRSTASVVRSILANCAGMLLALALLPVCLAIGVPFGAWAIAAGLVACNRFVQLVVAWSVRDASLTVALGAHGFSIIFRALSTALTLFFVGASVGADGDTPIGLDDPALARTALVIFILCFTLDVGIETLRRASQREEQLTRDHAATTQETSA